jgi:hypothetical protein
MEENYDKASPSGTYEGRLASKEDYNNDINTLVYNTEMPMEYEITRFF